MKKKKIVKPIQGSAAWNRRKNGGTPQNSSNTKKRLLRPSTSHAATKANPFSNNVRPHTANSRASKHGGIKEKKRLKLLPCKSNGNNSKSKGKQYFEGEEELRTKIYDLQNELKEVLVKMRRSEVARKWLENELKQSDLQLQSEKYSAGDKQFAEIIGTLVKARARIKKQEVVLEQRDTEIRDLKNTDAFTHPRELEILLGQLAEAHLEINTLEKESDQLVDHIKSLQSKVAMSEERIKSFEISEQNSKQTAKFASKSKTFVTQEKSGASPAKIWAEVTDCRNAIAVAVECEDFAEAARLKERILELSGAEGEQIMRLKEDALEKQTIIEKQNKEITSLRRKALSHRMQLEEYQRTERLVKGEKSPDTAEILDQQLRQKKLLRTSPLNGNSEAARQRFREEQERRKKSIADFQKQKKKSQAAERKLIKDGNKRRRKMERRWAEFEREKQMKIQAALDEREQQNKMRFGEHKSRFQRAKQEQEAWGKKAEEDFIEAQKRVSDISQIKMRRAKEALKEPDALDVYALKANGKRLSNDQEKLFDLLEEKKQITMLMTSDAVTVAMKRMKILKSPKGNQTSEKSSAWNIVKHQINDRINQASISEVAKKRAQRRRDIVMHISDIQDRIERQMWHEKHNKNLSALQCKQQNERRATSLKISKLKAETERNLKQEEILEEKRRQQKVIAKRRSDERDKRKLQRLKEEEQRKLAENKMRHSLVLRKQQAMRDRDAHLMKPFPKRMETKRNGKRVKQK